MNISQDTFNKLVTTTLLVYCMFMYTLSFITGKPLDLNSFLVLVAPLVAHTTHLIANTVNNNISSKEGQNAIQQKTIQ